MTGPYGFVWSPAEAGALQTAGEPPGVLRQCKRAGQPRRVHERPADEQPLSIRRWLRPAGERRRRRAHLSVGPAVRRRLLSKLFDNTPDAFYTTDRPERLGELRPQSVLQLAAESVALEHRDDLANRAGRARSGTGFVESSDLNLEYWKGHTTDAYYTITLPAPIPTTATRTCCRTTGRWRTSQPQPELRGRAPDGDNLSNLEEYNRRYGPDGLRTTTIRRPEGRLRGQGRSTPTPLEPRRGQRTASWTAQRQLPLRL